MKNYHKVRKQMRPSRRDLMIGAFGALCACSLQPRSPPLAELYEYRIRPRPPLIVIPGAFGTRLRRRSDGKELWPGKNRSLVFSNYDDLSLQIDPDTLEPVADDVDTSGLVLALFGRDFYRSLLEVLETVGGYRQGSTAAPAAGPESSYYIYEYDWRLDMTASVRGLHELIDRITEIHGDRRQQVDILAHSSGGLLARYYARYGVSDMLGEAPSQPEFTGSRRIRRLLLVGTPNLGTIQAVLSHVRGEEVGLRHIPEEVVATCPSAAQLMPHPDHSSLLDLRGDPLELDLYDIESWREWRWSIFSDEARDRVRRRLNSRSSVADHLRTLEAFFAKQLVRGRRLHTLLTGVPEPEEPRSYVFGGDCRQTLSRLVVASSRRGFRAYETARRIPGSSRSAELRELMYEPGDGDVTRSSLMGRRDSVDHSDSGPLSLEQAVFFCDSHRALLANPGVQDNLLYSLLREGV